MPFNFDTPPDLRDTDSQKWQKYAGRDVLPMWVADMDFQASPAIIEALHRRVDHGVFGYSRPTRQMMDTMVAAMASRYGWTVDPSWFVWLPGLVVGLNVASRAFAEPGEEVLSLAPVYPPFTMGPKYQGRTAVRVPLCLAAGRWDIDWDALERAVTPRSRLLIFCHPHNPIGRVWTVEEQRKLGAFCARHRLVLLSDDIHCDLMLEPGARHVPLAVGSPETASLTVTFMAPSKAYNLPGMSTAFAIIPDQDLRARFNRAAAGIVAEAPALGFTACEAAYGQGEPWRQELLAYLRGNRDLIVSTLAGIPSVRLEAPIQATYLAWLNVSDLKLAKPTEHFEKHGVGLSDGAPFGAAPGTYVRLNFGCPRARLQEGLARIRAAVQALG
jgi:cysteine-S-conjugate beta-lyase